jgi:hypothetical protein
MRLLRQSLLVATGLVVLLLTGLAHQESFAQEAPNLSERANSGTIPPLYYLPLIMAPGEPLPPVVYEAIPIMGSPTDRPAEIHGDLNLALRSYTTTTAALNLLDLNGDVDPDAPQLAGLFAPPRLPVFVAVYQVYDWDWSCGENGCRGSPIAQPEVTLLEVVTTPNEPIYIPSRNAQIYGGGYRAMLLYATASRLTLVYTREDTAAIGYVVHLEDIQVDAGLLALYQQENSAGRGRLPALRNGQRVGVASSNTFKVAIRDTGSFMEPRSRKDWWHGY